MEEGRAIPSSLVTTLSLSCNHFIRLYSEQDRLTEDQLRERIRNLNLPTLDTNKMEWLNKPFNPEEIKEAAFQIGPLKGIQDLLQEILAHRGISCYYFIPCFP